MKKMRFLTPKLLISISLTMFLFSLTSYSQHLEQYTVKKINSEIVIDGILDEDVWAQTLPTINFVILGDNQNAPNTATWAKMLWDENYLYVGFYCQDVHVWATYQDRDDPLYKEDVVEVYIDPDADGKNYLEVEVNPLNTIFDLWLTKPWSEGGQGNTVWTMDGLSTAITVAGTVSNNSDQDTSWICEMALPFSEMQFAANTMNFPPLEGENWRFNMYRFDRSSTSGSNGEATGWSQTSGGQHEPQNFGAIHFGGLGTSIAQSNNTIHDFILYQNYPNPFNPRTTIEFNAQKTISVSLKIFNAQGQEIDVLFDGVVAAGSHKMNWNASGLPSGIYMCQLRTKNRIKSQKLVLLK